MREPVDLGQDTIKLACRVDALKVSCEGGAGFGPECVQVVVERVLSAQTLTASPGSKPKRMSATLHEYIWRGIREGFEISVR
jgi:hypothetical protein